MVTNVCSQVHPSSTIVLHRIHQSPQNLQVCNAWNTRHEAEGCWRLHQVREFHLRHVWVHWQSNRELERDQFWATRSVHGRHDEKAEPDEDDLQDQIRDESQGIDEATPELYQDFVPILCWVLLF